MRRPPTGAAIRGFREAARFDLVDLEHEARDLAEACGRRRREALRAGKKLELAPVSSHQERLQHAELLDRVDETFETLGAARERALDLADGHEPQRRHAAGGDELVDVVIVPHAIVARQAFPWKGKLGIVR